MYWRFSGKNDNFWLAVSESGYQEIRGTASKHEVKTRSYYNPTGKNEAEIKPWFDEKERFDENLSKLELVWSINPSNATEGDISPCDSSDSSLYERCKADPESSHIFIEYYDFTDNYESPIEQRIKSIGVHIVLPPQTFNKVWKLFKRVLLEPSLEYNVNIDFNGWPRKKWDDKPDRLFGKYKDSYLTMDEFLNGKEYYCSEVDFHVGHYRNIIEEKEDLLEQDTLPSKEISMTENELLTTLSTIKGSLRWITFLLLVIALILIFK